MKFSFTHSENHSNRLPLLVGAILFFVFGTLSAQGPNQKKIEKKVNKYMQLAEEALAKNNFPIAEANYRKAVSLDTSNAVPSYNMGTLYYTKDQAAEAAERLLNAAKVSKNEPLKHKAFHNQGNAFMKQKNYKAAVQAYKNALRNDPTDDQTRYNFALAKKKLEEQQKKQKKNQKNSPKDNKDQKDQKKGDEQKKEDQKGGGDKNKEQKKGDERKDDKGDPKKQDQKNKNDQQQNKSKQNPGEKQQQKAAPGELSKQQVKNLLEAMKNQEQEVQQKINAQKAKGAKTNSVKDW